MKFAVLAGLLGVTALPSALEPGVRSSKTIDRGSMRLTGNIWVGRKLWDVSKDGSKGTFELGPQLVWGPDIFDVVMPVQIRANGRTETVSSGAVTIEVVRAYEVTPTETIASLKGDAHRPVGA